MIPPAPPRRQSPPSPTSTENPFLVGSSGAAAPFSPAVVSSAEPERAQSPPSSTTSRAGRGEEMRALKDAHREFRRGGLLKPFGFVVATAAVLAGLTYLANSTERREDKAAVLRALEGPKSGKDFTIGSSLSPERLTDEPRELTPKALRTMGGEAPSRPSGIVPEKQFAAAFKEATEKSKP